MFMYDCCCVHKQLNHDLKTDLEVDWVPYCIGHVNYVEVNACRSDDVTQAAHTANFLQFMLYAT